MLLLSGISLLVLLGQSESRFEKPGSLISQFLQSLRTSLPGGSIEARSDLLVGGCWVGGVYYDEGTYVQIDKVRRCECSGGIITQYCKFPSFQVQTKAHFKANTKSIGQRQITEKPKSLTGFQIKTRGPGFPVKQRQFPSVQVETKAPGFIVTERQRPLPSVQVETKAPGFSVKQRQRALPSVQVETKVPGFSVTQRQMALPSVQVETKGPGFLVTKRQRPLQSVQVETKATGFSIIERQRPHPSVHIETKGPGFSVTQRQRPLPSVQVEAKEPGFSVMERQRPHPSVHVETKAPGISVTQRQRQFPSVQVEKNAPGFPVMQRQGQFPSIQVKRKWPEAQVTLPSLQVQTKAHFKVNRKRLGRGQTTERQTQLPSFQVYSKGLGVAERSKADLKSVSSNPRVTSGRGTAKLFRLFEEEKKPVARTSNKTGCHVRDRFYNFPTDSVPQGATCRCTDGGMLWCWAAGIPTCSGCFVDGAFFEVGAKFRLEDGTDCSCHCGRQANNQVCMAGTLDKRKGAV